MLLGLALTTQSALIDLGYTGGQPASVAAETARLNALIGSYNAATDPDLALVTAPLWNGTQTMVEGTPKSITLDLSGFDGYLLFKYGPVDRFYYLSDTLQAPWTAGAVSYLGSGQYTFTSDVYNFSSGLCPPPTAGLSHYTTFSAVPEPSTWIAGSTLLLPFAAATLRIKFPRCFTKD